MTKDNSAQEGPPISAEPVVPQKEEERLQVALNSLLDQAENDPVPVLKKEAKVDSPAAERIKEATKTDTGANVMQSDGNAACTLQIKRDILTNIFANLGANPPKTEISSPGVSSPSPSPRSPPPNVATGKQIDQQTWDLAGMVHAEKTGVEEPPLPQSLPERGPSNPRTEPPPVQLGAYYGAPGEALRPAPAFVPSNLPPQERQAVPALRLPATERTANSNNNNDEDSLVEAQPVRNSDANLLVSGQATEFDPEAQDNHNKASKSQKCVRYTVLAGFVVIILAVIGIVVAVAITKKDDGNIPTRAPTSPPTISPTFSPTMSPTYPPLIVDNLPNFSLAALENPFSPQSMAYVWLDTHPNITYLEPWRRTQLFALATTYYAFDGRNWPLGLDKDWLDYEKQECDWYSNLMGKFSHTGHAESFTYGQKGGFACNQNGEYIQLRMASAADFGYSWANVTFPAEMGLLTQMEDMRLNENKFLGVATAELLPQSFYRLTNLHELHLGTNELDTPIPSQLGLLTNLDTLKLSYNKFYGPIPSQLGLLSKLVYLDLHYNELTGTIPSQLGQLSSAKRLRLNSNQLTGTIPSQLAQALDLRYLDVSNNNLSGMVPTQLGIPQGLGRIGFSNNSGLTGTIPDPLCALQVPSCSYSNANNKTRDCSLGFDCSPWLCGCNCECQTALLLSNNTAANNTLPEGNGDKM